MFHLFNLDNVAYGDEFDVILFFGEEVKAYLKMLQELGSQSYVLSCGSLDANHAATIFEMVDIALWWNHNQKITEFDV